MVIGMNPTQVPGIEPAPAVQQAEVARRAFQKWLARSRPDAGPLQDWLEAENEVRQLGEIARMLSEAEKKLHRQELERGIAREVQQGLLPKAMPQLAGFKFAGRSLAAAEVGGDCFDFFPSQVDGKENLDVLIADASGHGMAAALLMAEARAYVRALALTCADPGTLLDLTNMRLAEDLLPGHFVTLFLLRLEPGTRSLRYAGAGHWPAYVLDRHGAVRQVLVSAGEPVGIDALLKYSTGPPISLEGGDVVFLFTDGVVEATSPRGTQFGLERTLEVIRTHRQSPPEEILEQLFQAVGKFAEAPVQDDATAVVIQAEDPSA